MMHMRSWRMQRLFGPNDRPVGGIVAACNGAPLQVLHFQIHLFVGNLSAISIVVCFFNSTVSFCNFIMRSYWKFMTLIRMRSSIDILCHASSTVSISTMLVKLCWLLWTWVRTLLHIYISVISTYICIYIRSFLCIRKLLVIFIQNGYWLTNCKKIWPRISTNHKTLGM